MKNKIISLTKVMLKNSFNKNSLSNNKKSKGKIILYFILAIYIVGIFGILSYNLIVPLKQINQEAIFLSLFVICMSVLILFQSIITGINVFYYSKDIEFILPLPLKPYEILISKLNVVLITEYITEFIFAIPVIVVYGIVTGAGVLFYISSIAFLLLLPIIPLLISSLVVMVIMSFSKISKNKDRFQVIATFIAIILSLLLQFAFTGTEDLTEQQMAEKIYEANGLVEIVENYFITLKPMINGMTENNTIIAIVEFIKVLSITLIMYIIYLIIGQKLYFKGIVGSSSKGNTKAKKIDISKDITKSKISRTYVIKEIRTLLRNPIFFIQCVLPSVLMPIIFFVCFLAGINAEQSLEIQKELSSIDLNNIYAVIVITLIVQFFSMLIYVSSTAISRDGKNAIFMKYIPISLYKQIIYKAMPNFILVMLSTTLVLIVSLILVKIQIIPLIFSIIICILTGIIHSYLGILIDLRRPKLEWDTEYAVVKQNMNLIWPLVISLVLGGIILGIGLLLSNTSIYISGLSIIGVLAIIAYKMDRYIFNNQNKIFQKIN